MAEYKGKEIEYSVLVELARDGDNGAMDLILADYKNLVSSLARRYFLQNAETEDLVQEGMIGLYYAIKHFDKEKGMSFKNFACLCVKSRICDTIKRFAYKSSVLVFGMDFSELEGIDPEENIVNMESSKELMLMMSEVLSNLEHRVFTLYLSGFSIAEICEAIKKDGKSIDNAIQRSKQKLRVLFDKKRK
jgi:RNA polymerase sporulation-specific sigma factor